MGTLRTVLAIAVVLAHCWPESGSFLPGHNAVQLFYIISGFLISFVLLESNSYKTRLSFYINRALRLYPIYFVIAALTLIFYILTDEVSFFQVYRSSPLAAGALLVFVNIALFGQDWIMFLAVNRNNLQFSADFSNSTVPLYNGLLVHQAWTLGLELSFYAIAPFILKKRKLIVGLIFLSLLLRLSLCILGIGRHDPWTYRFFPCELALFLLGALSHQFILPFFRVRPFFMKTGADYGTYFLLLLTIFYTAIPIPEPYKEICFYMVFAMLIPLAFVYQNRTAFDRLIGELSYSIYVVHTLVIAFIFRAALSIGFNNRHFLAICCVVVSILAASALVVFVGGPLEKIRTRFRRRREAGVAT